MERTLSVVIADDHLLYRRSLASLLERSGIMVVGEAPNGEVAVTLARERDPDVVVMDLNMPGTSGLEATRRLALDGPPVLILTVSAQDDDVTEALRSGAVGYLLKERPVEDVVAAIRAASASSLGLRRSAPRRPS